MFHSLFTANWDILSCKDLRVVKFYIKTKKLSYTKEFWTRASEA